MNILDIIKTALQALITHKGRSFLTVLGIVIGIGAIIIVMSIGDSATGLILEEVQSFGPSFIVVNPGRPSQGAIGAQFESVLTDSLVEKDIEDLKNPSNVPDALAVAPSVMGAQAVTYGSESFAGTLWGIDNEVFRLYKLKALEGDFFTEEDVRSKSDTALIGKRIKEELFGLQDPIGQKIKIGNKKFRVIGVFGADSAIVASSLEGIVAVPYTTAQQYVLGIKHFHEVIIEARSPEAVAGTVEDIKRTLRDNHNIDNPDKDDFIITTSQDTIEIVNSVLGAITGFLAVVAAISLVVGGIGVMNIMFVSVTERTREIGLRKAIGATHKNILTQFLIEAVFLTGIGGVIGIIGGLSITFLITLGASFALDVSFPFIISIPGILLGLGVASGTGLLFGIFPARQAAKKSPMEALRYE